MLNESLFKYETELYLNGYKYICGVDEAGRGPLAGPVVAAAVIFEQGKFVSGVDDSKKLTPLKREKLFYEIRKNALCYALGMVSPERIDQINILQATFEAMRLSVSKLSVKPDFILIDGKDEPFEGYKQKHIIKGDSKSYSIAAASILAKVVRDKIMNFYDNYYPEYNFRKHKGYATKEHMEKIKSYGRCPIHRNSFKLKHEKPLQNYFNF